MSIYSLFGLRFLCNSKLYGCFVFTLSSRYRQDLSVDACIHFSHFVHPIRRGLLVFRLELTWRTNALCLGSWRELATESLLVYNLTNAGGPIIEAVYGGQTMLRNSSIFWIDTTYSLLSVLSMWNSFVALAFMAVYLRCSSRIDKHLVFIGFVIAPKWMLFYLICNSVRS